MHIQIKTLVIVLAILLLLFFAVASGRGYTNFYLDENRCERHFEKCTCIGVLVVLESYPPQINCQGVHYCSNHDVTVCR